MQVARTPLSLAGAVAAIAVPVSTHDLLHHHHLGRLGRDRSEARSLRLAPRRAGDPGVTIRDFQFTPGTTTIHVGDTVTWTNDGPSAHTATASNGSFDTGTLQPGQSAAHTFTQAGTFAYICRIHPFMHGTIDVVGTAAASTGSPGSGVAAGAGSGASAGNPSASTSSTAASGSTTAGGRILPFTGTDLIAMLSVAFALLGGGLALRRLPSGQQRGRTKGEGS